jgi:hypothetical protein
MRASAPNVFTGSYVTMLIDSAQGILPEQRRRVTPGEKALSTWFAVAHSPLKRRLPERKPLKNRYRGGTLHRNSLWLNSYSSLGSPRVTSLSGFQSPISNVFETIRLPGFSC